MLDSIRSFFDRRMKPAPAAAAPEDPDARLRVAACALLLEVAHADRTFDEDEKRHIHEAVGRHFGLEPAAVEELVALAEAQRREATDLFQFTSLVNASYDEGQRMVLAELLWRVVLADGTLSPQEDYLMRKVANLLELRPGYLAEARKRVRPQA